MKIFIDSANLEQIKEAHDLGILDGVTASRQYWQVRGAKEIYKTLPLYL